MPNPYVEAVLAHSPRVLLAPLADVADVANGQWVDLSGLGHHGVRVGASYAVSSGGPAQALPGYVNTDGVDDRVEIADHPDLDLTGAFTVVHWLRPNTSVQESWAALWAKGDSTYQARITTINTDYRIDIRGTADRWAVLANAVVYDSEWRWYACVWNGSSNITLYRGEPGGGALTTMGSVNVSSVTLSSNGFPLTIGAQSELSGALSYRRFFNGRHAGFALIPSALTLEQAQAIYDASFQPITGDVVNPTVDAGDDVPVWPVGVEFGPRGLVVVDDGGAPVVDKSWGLLSRPTGSTVPTASFDPLVFTPDLSGDYVWRAQVVTNDGTTNRYGTDTFTLSAQEAVESGEGGSEAVVEVASEGGGVKHAEGGSEAEVGIGSEGAGARASEGGSETSVEVAVDGAGSKGAFGGSETGVDLVAESGQGGASTRRGGAEATVLVSQEAQGVSGRQGGSESVSAVQSDGDGSKGGRGGSEAEVQVAAEGGGQRQVAGQGGSVADVVVSAEGGGSKAAAGTGESTVEVGADGAGAKHAEGGSEAHLWVAAEGAGSKDAAGGIVAEIFVVAEGGGQRGIQPGSGGSEAIVVVAVEGAGVKHAAGGSEAVVGMTVDGDGWRSGWGGLEAVVVVAAEGFGYNPELESEGGPRVGALSVVPRAGTLRPTRTVGRLSVTDYTGRARR